MKKWTLISVLVLALMAVPVVAYAAGFGIPGMGLGTGQGNQGTQGNCPYSGVDSSTLTDEQKAEIAAAFQSRMEERKAAVQEQLNAGTITRDQAEAALQRIDAMIQYHQENGFTCQGQGQGQGLRQGRGNGQNMGPGRGDRQGSNQGNCSGVNCTGVCPFGN